VFAKIGTAEVATDPMPPSVADTFVMLKPRAQWPDPEKARPTSWPRWKRPSRKIPGNNYEFTQPIQMRFNELISGVRSDVAVKVYGDDLDVMTRSRREIEGVLKAGSRRGRREDRADHRPAAAHRPARPRSHRPLRPHRGRGAGSSFDRARRKNRRGQVFAGDRRFDLVVRLPENLRTDLARSAIFRCRCPSSTTTRPRCFRRCCAPAVTVSPRTAPPLSFIPLREVAKIEIAPGPTRSAVKTASAGSS
jgi:cobalt-zinc-cadmium resistance protein CzcA